MHFSVATAADQRCKWPSFDTICTDPLLSTCLWWSQLVPFTVTRAVESAKGIFSAACCTLSLLWDSFNVQCYCTAIGFNNSPYADDSYVSIVRLLHQHLTGSGQMHKKCCLLLMGNISSTLSSLPCSLNYIISTSAASTLSSWQPESSCRVGGKCCS